MRIVLCFVVFVVLFNSVYLNENQTVQVPTNVIISKRYKGFIKDILSLFNLLRKTNSENNTYLEGLFYQNDTLKDEEAILDWFAQGLYTPNATRREMERQLLGSKTLDEMMALGKQEEPREDSILEPYWENGDWVFYRTGTPTTEMTKLNWWQKATTALIKDIYRECDRSCSYYFVKYGVVCGHRYNTHKWVNEYATFDNICDLEMKNCWERNKRPMWHPLYQGKCKPMSDTFPYEYKNIRNILQFKKKYDPYIYTTTPDPPRLQ